MAGNSNFGEVFFYFIKIIFCPTTWFILKQLDHSPSLSVSDSQLDYASLTVCSIPDNSVSLSIIVKYTNCIFSYTTEIYAGTKVKEKIRMFKKVADMFITLLWCQLQGTVFNATICTKNWFRIACQSICCNNVVGVWSLFKNVLQHVLVTNVALKSSADAMLHLSIFYATMLRYKLSLKIVPCNITFTIAIDMSRI